MTHLKSVRPLLAMLCASIAISPCLEAAVGDTRVAKWKDDRTGTFLLMFDDGWPGQVQVAIPEIQKRGLVATFYMVPQKGEFQALADRWAEALEKGGVVYGNHTMTHQGITDLENGRWEMGECARIIREELQPIPGRPNRLLSFARPGGVKHWNITDQEYFSLFEEFNLVDRPTFRGRGAMYHMKTAEEMIALGEGAIALQDMDYLIVHGVERLDANWQDFWAMPQAVFFPLLDYLKEKSDAKALWVTDHISYHQYETERKSAVVKTLKVISNGIQLELKSDANSTFYDHPLTLVTEVPASWKECNITQGENQSSATAVNGSLMFDALPNGPPISIWPAAKN